MRKIYCTEAVLSLKKSISGYDAIKQYLKAAKSYNGNLNCNNYTVKSDNKGMVLKKGPT